MGLWLSTPDEDLCDSSCPPFIAAWAFVKRVSSQGGRDVTTYDIRGQDEVITVPLHMPRAYNGPPRTKQMVKSAAFVQYIRWRYKEKADGILGYLRDKFQEYEHHSGGVGFTGHSVMYRVWNHETGCKMKLNEMLELLMNLQQA